MRETFCAFLALFLCLATFGRADALDGKVVDASTHQPIKDAFVAISGVSVRTDADGSFHIGADGAQIAVRAWGYSRSQLATPRSPVDPIEIPLQPFSPRAVYLSIFGVAYHPILDAILKLQKKTQLNALVVDVKDDRGLLLFPENPSISGTRDSSHAKKVQDQLAQFHSDGLYVIARIVVFKDPLFVQSHPEMALRADDGSVVQESDHIEWTDPRSKTVRDRNIAIAVEAARVGFDEIQFDYVRFPAMTEHVRARRDEGMRRATIDDFLSRARAALTPYNVFIAADIFGYSCWDLNDTNIGQKLEDVASTVDYICPMLYPSSFRNGIPASPMPLDHLDKIVRLSLDRACERTGFAAVRFRPWLQAFRDYRFDRRRFGPLEVRTQILAAEGLGTDGWMLWNPRNSYSQEALPAHGEMVAPTSAQEH